MDIRLVGSSAFAFLAVTAILMNMNSVRAPQNTHYFLAEAVEISGNVVSQEVLDRNFQSLLAQMQIDSTMALENESVDRKRKTTGLTQVDSASVKTAIETTAAQTTNPEKINSEKINPEKTNPEKTNSEKINPKKINSETANSEKLYAETTTKDTTRRFISSKNKPIVSHSRKLGEKRPHNMVTADTSIVLTRRGQTLDKHKQVHSDQLASDRHRQRKNTDLPADILAALPFSTNATGQPTITGFLTPQGFKRPHWQHFGNDPVIIPESVHKEKFIVMLDPGHGGSDPGAVAKNGLQEKDLTLDIAKRIKLFLSEFDDVEVVLTRNHDHGLTRQSRVNRIKHSEADMVISLHFNHLPQPDLNIVESFYAGPKNVAKSRAHLAQRALARAGNIRHISSRGGVDISFTQGSKRLAKTLHQRIFAEVSFENESVQNAGVKEKTFYVLTQSYKPGTLIEITCLSNPREAARLRTDEYKNRLAASLADGIRNYYESLRLSPLNSATDIGV